MSLFLGIDTSNYTTSTALFNDETGEMLQEKKLLPVKKGQLGLRQSDAVFHHTAQLHALFSRLVKDIDVANIAAIGVSTKPRPMEGSYMPCFTVGENTAKILSSALSLPLFSFSHQEGHISAAIYSSGRDDLFTKNFIAFHVSGGTTEAVIAEGKNYSFSAKLAASSLDLHAGQAIDRVGVMLGLEFPCGPQLETLALINTEPITVHPAMKGCNCCLSGIENLCKKLFESGYSREYVAAYCIEYINKALQMMTERLIEKYGNLPLLYAGGVMSDKIIKDSISKRFDAVFAKPAFSADNAAGIAYLAYRKFKYV